jgi:hypothetical protein
MGDVREWLGVGLKSPVCWQELAFCIIVIAVVVYGVVVVAFITNTLGEGSIAHAESEFLGGDALDLEGWVQKYRIIILSSWMWGVLIILRSCNWVLRKYSPKFAGLSSSRQRSVTSNILRAGVQLILFVATSDTIATLQWKASRGFGDSSVRTMIMITTLAYLPVYFSELLYRIDFSWLMSVHHIVGVMATAPILDSVQYIQGLPDYYFVHFMCLQAIFASAEFITPVAITVYYLGDDKAMVARVLHWTKLGELAMKITLNVGVIFFYARYYEFLTTASAVGIPVVVVLVGPAQLFVPYVLGKLERKAWGIATAGSRGIEKEQEAEVGGDIHDRNIVTVSVV